MSTVAFLANLLVLCGAPAVLWVFYDELKPHLFMETKKLSIAYPTVQHTVDVDVVGLQIKEEHEL